MRWGGVLIGAAGLAVADAVLSGKSAAGNVGGWLEGAGTLVSKFLDPTVPAFNTSSSSSSSSSSSAKTTTPPASSGTTPPSDSGKAASSSSSNSSAPQPSVDLPLPGLV